MTVKIYSTSSCPYCVIAKEYLKKHKIPFVEVNVSEDRNAAMEIIQKTGQRGVPVIEINGEMIVGFNEPAIKKALKLK